MKTTTAAVLVLTLLSSCSLVMEKLPAKYDGTTAAHPPYCTASKGWVAWDGVNAAAGFIGFATTLGVYGSVEEEDRTDDFSSTVFATAFAFAVYGTAWVVDATIANHHANRCRAARREFTFNTTRKRPR